MDLFDEEILKLWRLLNEHNSRYLMVGGFATTFHGFNRATEDLDLWIKDTPENRRAFRNVLKMLDVGDFPTLETTELMPGYSSITLNSGFELDLMTSMKGLPQSDFDECYLIAPTARIENIPVKFLHINHLIQAKKAAGRPKDLIDVAELEKIRDYKSNS